MTKEMERNGLMGERLLKLRNQSSLTQEELAERLDVSRQSISKWELNKTLPDVDKLIQLSEMYQVSIDYLIKGEEAGEEDKRTDKTGDEEKKGEAAGKGGMDFAVKQMILLLCIFLSGFMCLCMAAFTGRLLINNAFNRDGERNSFDYYSKTLILPIILGIVFLIFFIVFIYGMATVRADKSNVK